MDGGGADSTPKPGLGCVAPGAAVGDDPGEVVGEAGVAVGRGVGAFVGVGVGGFVVAARTVTTPDICSGWISQK